MIGKTISHYKIIERLGRGEMGVVYKAQDLKLDRFVALKFLPPELTRDEESKKRFIHEAKAASALEHTNICNIHEIDETDDGQIFIVMSCYEGESLKKKIESGPLNIEEAVNIAIQIAEGLCKAHEKGIIHRDIKPANIFITNDGVVKILDFGLAKVTGQTQLTKMGSTIGTVSYMSPEQTRGERVDHRTDIWSFGVVLYEMVTGELPFKGDYDQAVIYSILNEEPESILVVRKKIPVELANAIEKMLIKNPDKRYQSIAAVQVDLQVVRTKIDVAGDKVIFNDKPQPSVAVLPFINMSADLEQEYFCDGIAEELINALAHIKGLRVVARISAFAFKGKEIDAREIGRKLNVDALLEGSVRRAGNRLRITAQLVNAADGYHLWSERFDREMKDVFAIQDEISLSIVENLKVQLLGEEKAKIVKRHTEVPCVFLLKSIY